MNQSRAFQQTSPCARSWSVLHQVPMLEPRMVRIRPTGQGPLRQPLHSLPAEATGRETAACQEDAEDETEACLVVQPLLNLSSKKRTRHAKPTSLPRKQRHETDELGKRTLGRVSCTDQQETSKYALEDAHSPRDWSAIAPLIDVRLRSKRGKANTDYPTRQSTYPSDVRNSSRS